MRLRVATWNIWGNGEPWRYMRERSQVRGAVPGSPAVTEQPVGGIWPRRKALIVSTLRAADVDVVALQEVIGDSVADQPHSDELAAALQWNSSAVTAGGLAVLSRHEVMQSTTVPLPHRGAGYGADEALHAVVALGEGCLDVIVLHSSPRSAESRVDAAQTIVAYIERMPVRPIVVMGDFNTVDETAPELDLLHGAGLQDTASACCAADATMPSHDPIIRLDYVFAGRGLSASASRRIGGEPDDRGYYASDHLGVMSDVLDDSGNVCDAPRNTSAECLESRERVARFRT